MIDNGQTLTLQIDAYHDGEAGVATISKGVGGATLEAAFRPNNPKSKPKPGTKAVLDGVPHVITSIVPSVAGLVCVQLKEV